MTDPAGYNVSGSPIAVDIFHYTAPTADIIIDLADMDEWDLIEQNVQAAASVNKTFTVNSSYSLYGSYAAYKWYLDGTLVGTSSTYTFNKSKKDVYQLVLVVTDYYNGESRSGRCRITVGD